MDAGAVAYLSPLVVNQDAKLKRQVSTAPPLGWHSACLQHGCACRLGSRVRQLCHGPCPVFCTGALGRLTRPPRPPSWLAQVCCALAQIAKHSVDLAEVVVEAEVFPKLLTCLKVWAAGWLYVVGTGRREGCIAAAGCGQPSSQRWRWQAL